ncbi:MAG: hypothetical protein AMJ54_07910 [Deltaproteobacteria bacterium SG8_13]|nr:MAG: hypothetical protein AMJ54_07910 [Deltaproteobacteria bacterium SG8_13]
MTRLMIIFIALALGIGAPASGYAQDIKLWHRISVYQDGKDGPLLHPEGVACPADSSLIVADSGNGRLLRYRIETETALAEVTEVKLPQLNSPTKVQAGGNGEIYVLNRTPLQIVRLADDGRFISVVKLAGQPVAVKSFAVHPSGDLFVLDLAAKRVLVMTPGGNVRVRIGFPAGTDFLSDIAVDPKGKVLAVDGVAGIVYALDAAGRSFTPITDSLKPYARYPSILTTDAGGRIFLSDRNGSRIVVLSSSGAFLGRLSGRGWKDGLLQYPSQVCISPRGQLTVADTLNNRVQVFDVSN